MAGEALITITGGCTRDPELRFTPNGHAVTNIDVAVTPRTFDKNSNSWKDGQTEYYRCTAWKGYAENIVESYRKGTQIFVTGYLKTGSYTDKNGATKTTLEIQIEETGPLLRFQRARVEKSSGGGGSSQQSSQSSGGGGFGSSSSSGGFGSGTASSNDEPPF